MLIHQIIIYLFWWLVFGKIPLKFIKLTWGIWFGFLLSLFFANLFLWKWLMTSKKLLNIEKVMYYRATCLTLKAHARNKIKSSPLKKVIIFSYIVFAALILRNFLYFLKRKLFLCFAKREPRKSSLHFRWRTF